MNFKLKFITLSALAVLPFISSQAQVEVQAPFNSTAIPAGSPERLRVSNGFFTHRENGNVGSFTAADQWQSIGRVQGAAQTLYGYRVQRAGRALTLGFDGPLQPTGSVTPTLAEAFIEWGGNNTLAPAVTPGDLLIRNFTSPFSAAPVNRFRFTALGDSYAENGILGHLQSGSFGDISGASQWLGNGPARIAGVIDPTIYGNRIQQGAQSMLFNLVSGKPVVGWGDQGQDMVFRYFTNRFNPSLVRDVLTLQSSGRSNFGSFFTSNATVSIRGEDANGLDILVKNNGASTQIGGNALVITANNTAIGFYGKAQSSFTLAETRRPQNYGVWGQAGTAEGAISSVFNVGVFGEVTPGGSRSINYGVYGFSPASSTGAFTAGGYFIGGLFCDAFTVFSDQKLKNEVQTEGDITSKIMQLRPVNYMLKQGDKKYNFSKALQHGFIAQEMEKVFPELVVNVRHQAPGNNDSDVEDIKGVNYVGLISVLTRGMQEQQQTIQSQDEKIASMEKDMEAMKKAIQNLSAANPGKAVQLNATAGYELKQNVPNPFNQVSTISFSVPAGEKNIVLAIFDLNGKMITQFNNLAGKNQVSINANELQPGIYIYSLLAGGQEMLSKRMVVTR
jgi:hypothetical protein